MDRKKQTPALQGVVATSSSRAGLACVPHPHMHARSDASGLLAEPPQRELLLGFWSAVKFATTLGDLRAFEHRQRLLMLGALMFVMVIGAYAVSRLTGMLQAPMSSPTRRVVPRNVRLMDCRVMLQSSASLAWGL